MFYQALNSKIECFNKCVKITKLLLMTSTSVFSMLTFIYLEKLVEELKNTDFESVVETFKEFRECVARSHICS